MTIDYPHYTHPSLTAFAPIAREYCALLEAQLSLPPVRLLQEVHLLLPRLYVGALALPNTGVLFDSSREDEEVTFSPPTELEPDPETAEWMAHFHALQKHLGPLDQYREVYDPHEPLSEPEVTGSLADDLRDIHRDLRRGLRRWDAGETGEALWEWRFNFEFHWGEHLTGALRALFTRCAWHDLSWPGQPDGAA